MLSSLDAPESIRLVLSKFGTFIQDICSRQALKIENEAQGEPKFRGLLKFLVKQISLMSHPDYSRDAYAESKEKKAVKAIGGGST